MFSKSNLDPGNVWVDHVHHFSLFNHAGSRFIEIISNPKQSRVYMLFEKATPVVDSKASSLAPISSNKVTNDE